MRVRQYKDKNYKAVFFNGKTIRMKFDQTKPFLTPETPDLEDVALNSLCYAACTYCYTSATKKGVNFPNIVDKAHEVWGSLKLEDRPFQIAIGGAGESTIHPDWVEFVKTVKGLGIMPNYTTNGMHLSDNVLKGTDDYCGGVAVSYHPHIKNVFDRSIDKLSELNTKLNAHIIIGDNQSLVDLKHLYNKYKDKIDYFVILPYQAAGRAIVIDVDNVWKETFKWVSSLDIERQGQFAFGALFYEWMKINDVNLQIDLYEPEMFSGYRLMDDTYKILRKSSYNLEKK